MKGLEILIKDVVFVAWKVGQAIIISIQCINCPSILYNNHILNCQYQV